MKLHAVLRDLVDAHEEGVLSEPSVFRGVLDDYLDESMATTGEINLLVDTVRFGALSSLSTMIDSGAEPERAVAEAGGRLARERGGDDTRAGSWAVAVLGYALGKVPESVVDHYPSPSNASTHAPGAQPVGSFGAPGAAATQWPAPSAAAAPAGMPSPTAPPVPVAVAPTGVPRSGPTPTVAPGGPVGQSSWPPPSSGGRAKRPIVLFAAIGVVLVVVVGGLVGFLATRGGDDPKPEAGGGGPETPVEVDTSAEAVTERYSGLGGGVANDASECAVAETAGDATEVLDCTLPAGTLRLVTYSSATALETARNQVIDLREGTIQEVTDDAAFYSFDPANSGSSEPPVVYWDSFTSLQSAQITGTGSADGDTVLNAFDATNPTVAKPTEPTNPDLIDFLGSLGGGIKGCERVPSYSTDVLQEHSCSFKKYVVYAAKFADLRTLKSARLEATNSQAESDVYPADDSIYNDVNGNGTQDPSETELGVVRGYTIEGSENPSSILYVDNTLCRCYVELWNVSLDGGAPIDPEDMADDLFG